jgi:pyruvate/2-oxoglutarate dehydrogenase complex dihydrolipoamide dehydrogenase (E3) component
MKSAARAGQGLPEARHQILAGHRVQGIETTDKACACASRPGEGKEEKVLEAEQAMMAIGFRPNTKDIGLEEAGRQAHRARVYRDR